MTRLSHELDRIAFIGLVVNTVLGFCITVWFVSALGYKNSVPPLRERIKRFGSEEWIMCLCLSPFMILFLIYLLLSGAVQFITRTGMFARD